MWSANNTIHVFQSPHIFYVTGEKKDSPIPRLLYSRSNWSIARKLLQHWTRGSRGVAQTTMNWAASRMYITWLPSKHHSAWCISPMKAARKASCRFQYVTTSWSLQKFGGCRQFYVHYTVSEVLVEAHQTVRSSWKMRQMRRFRNFFAAVSSALLQLASPLVLKQLKQAGMQRKQQK